MAEVEVKDSGKGGKKGQQKKMKIHVDFTPMVDMNMLFDNLLHVLYYVE